MPVPFFFAVMGGLSCQQGDLHEQRRPAACRLLWACDGSLSFLHSWGADGEKTSILHPNWPWHGEMHPTAHTYIHTYRHMCRCKQHSLTDDDVRVYSGSPVRFRVAGWINPSAWEQIQDQDNRGCLLPRAKKCHNGSTVRRFATTVRGRTSSRLNLIHRAGRTIPRAGRPTDGQSACLPLLVVSWLVLCRLVVDRARTNRRRLVPSSPHGRWLLAFDVPWRSSRP